VHIWNMLQYMDLFFEVYACVLWKCTQDRNRESFIMFPELHILFPVTLKIFRFSLSYGNYCNADGVSASGAKWLFIQRNWSKFLQMREIPWGVDAQGLLQSEKKSIRWPTGLQNSFWDSSTNLVGCVTVFLFFHLFSCLAVYIYYKDF
jgi:hypothetical protein